MRSNKFIWVGFALLIVVASWWAKRDHGTKPDTNLKHTFTDLEYDQHYEVKKQALERILGPMHNLVGHAIIPFEMGGAVDMYYFTNGIPGTGFATMELIEPDGNGPKPNKTGTYELVAFTRLPMPSNSDTNNPFHKIERRMCGVLTAVGRYAFEDVMNPKDTCEIPGAEGEPNRCLILDDYGKLELGRGKHGLLLCIEVFKSEMDYAMKHGSNVVLKKLKAQGFYPYSDLSRKPVY